MIALNQTRTIEMVGMATAKTGRWSYRQVLRDRRLSGLLAGDAVSKVGDGMGFIALPLLALRLHGSLDKALAISLVAAGPYVLAVAVSLFFGLGKRRFRPRRVLLADSAARGLALLVCGALTVSGAISFWFLVVLLSAGSVLRLLSASARRLAAAALTDGEGRLAVNGVLGTTDSLALYVAGPALGGLLSGLTSPGAVLLINGSANLVLLAVAAVVLPPDNEPRPEAGQPGEQVRRDAPESGWSIMRRTPLTAQLLVVVFLFYLFYGPVEVALPLLVTDDLHADSGSLGTLWTAFGLGALLGAVFTNSLRRFSQPIILLTVIGVWAACVAVVGASVDVLIAGVAMAIGGVVYGPFTAVAYTLVQDSIPPEEHQPVIAVWTAGTTFAAPIGLGLGGPLVAASGARGSLFVSAAVTGLLVPFAFVWLLRMRL